MAQEEPESLLKSIAKESNLLFFIDILLHSVNPKNNIMTVKHLVAEIHDLLIRVYGEGLSKKKKKKYENLPVKDLQDLRVKLMLKL